MAVIFSRNVRTSLSSYRASLRHYPISRKRAIEKYDNMIAALRQLDSLPMPQLCVHRDLGQRFGADGNPIFLKLRRFNYTDESGFQWAFSCLYDVDEKNVYITMMMPSQLVKEAIENHIKPILEFWQRLNRI